MNGTTTPRFCAAALALAGFLCLAPESRPQTPADVAAATPLPHAVWLESLDLRQISQAWGEPHAARSVENNPLTIAGTVYPHGVGTHATSNLRVLLHGAATRFVAMAGVDDETNGGGSVDFQVIVDGKKVADTGIVRGHDKPRIVSVDLTGARVMILQVGDAGDGITSDHADWAGAQIVMASDTAVRPEASAIAQDPPRLVIPAADPRPAIHGPRVVGATPGCPFLFLIPATGDGPLTYTAANLPAGLIVDPETGIISGALTRGGSTTVRLTVRGPRGLAVRGLVIVGGAHKLAQTPPMGWNSWNVWAGQVDEGKVKAAADEMIASGLASHGFAYVNVDDTWEAGRDTSGNIQPNAKFPDMKGLGDYIHGKGLRFGIYSSPGPTTCGGYTASYRHEDQDAESYAAWGVDYLKYDWCSYGNVATGTGQDYFEKPYAVMRDSLDKTGRDIVYSLCQYGMGDVWTWGSDDKTAANCWRTHGDIQDDWGSLKDIYEHEAGHEAYGGPGHWNDPDMLMVGLVGFGNPHPTHLTPNEQITHISLWCLFSSPLLIGCDMTHLDKLTLALLSNDEVLDIDQDPLGHPATRIAKDGDLEVWARPLFDGTRAVGLVNGADDPATITAAWETLGIAGRQPVRDLWLHKNVGRYTGNYSVTVPAHGTVLLKIGTPSASSL